MTKILHVAPLNFTHRSLYLPLSLFIFFCLHTLFFSLHSLLSPLPLCCSAVPESELQSFFLLIIMIRMITAQTIPSRAQPISEEYTL